MSDELENIIDKISDSIVKVEQVDDKKSLVKAEKKEIDVTDTSEIEEELIKQTTDDRKKADQIFEMFYTDLGLRTDRSQASKEALTKSLELKISASRNLIDLLKIKKEASNKLGVFVNTVSSKKAGIDIRNIENEIE